MFKTTSFTAEMFIRYTLPFVIVAVVSLAIPSKRLEKKKEQHTIGRLIFIIFV